MLVRQLSIKGLSPFSGFLRLNSVKRLSDDSKSKQSDAPKEESEHLPKEKITELLDNAVLHNEDLKNEWATSPYPEGSNPNEVQKPVRPQIDPQDTSILMFPGQGVIKVGQVEQYLRFPGVKELFDTAHEVLGYDLLKICLNGPQAKLDQTNFNQPATVVTCLAALEKLREERPSALQNCKVSMGYSIGEITSLIVSSAISYEDGLKLINARSTAMHYASTRAKQGMLLAYQTRRTNINNAFKDAKKWAMNLGVSEPVCGIAAYLYTETKVIGGHMEALDYIQKNKQKYNFAKLTKLPVSGAFHTPLMEPALHAVKNALQQINIEKPRCITYSNYTSQPVTTDRHIPNLILKQIVRPVKWEQCVQKVYSRPEGTSFPKTYDIGSNGSMKSILRRINARAAETTIIV